MAIKVGEVLAQYIPTHTLPGIESKAPSMTDDFDSGTYKITSFSEGHVPIGVNNTKPGFQDVYANAPVHHVWLFLVANCKQYSPYPFQWKIVRVGRDKYRLSVGPYRYVGALHGKVIASTERRHGTEWKIEHQELQNAYTWAEPQHFHVEHLHPFLPRIEPENEPGHGWTVPEESSDLQGVTDCPLLSR